MIGFGFINTLYRTEMMCKTCGNKQVTVTMVNCKVISKQYYYNNLVIKGHPMLSYTFGLVITNSPHYL